jgi:hypothetical protein
MCVCVRNRVRDYQKFVIEVTIIASLNVPVHN